MRHIRRLSKAKQLDWNLGSNVLGAVLNFVLQLVGIVGTKPADTTDTEGESPAEGESGTAEGEA